MGLRLGFLLIYRKLNRKKHVFRIGDEVKLTAWTKMYNVSVYAYYYRVGGLKITKKAEQAETTQPPY